MVGEPKSSRRRQSSAASGTTQNIPGHTRQPSRPSVQTKSAQVADPFLQDFLDPAFDAAEYLNATLPPLQTTGTSATAGPRSNATAAVAAATAQGSEVPLAELSTQAQAILTQLNAHTTRLSATLTQLTDDILRSGNRLAYEVELLRGEALSLAELLTDGLHNDVARFAPGGLDAAEANTPTAPPTPTAAAAAAGEPPYVSRLRTLELVRERLDAVIKTFGDAMEFVFPPSELSVRSSFLSVSAPDADGEMHSTEEKGRQVLQKLRDEVAALLAGAGGSADPVAGIEEAARRIEQLKDLATVWKGTAEEKGRARFIDSLAKMVEDRHRELLREVEQVSRRDGGGERLDAAESSARKSSADAEQASTENRGYGGYGLISQLQKLRGGL